MLVLCVSLITFWWQFPIYTPLRKFARQSIRIFGTLAMINALFLFTPISHDLVVNLSSGLGMLATLGIVAGLFYNRWWSLFYFILFNMFLVLINNVFYYTGGLIDYLPVVQKISFLSFLLWVFLICIKTIRYSYSKTPS
jgi:hypothetical protein